MDDSTRPLTEQDGIDEQELKLRYHERLSDWSEPGVVEYRSGPDASAVAIRTFPKTQTRHEAGSVRVEFRSLGWLRENAS